MGLAGRRAAKEFETNVFPKLKAEIDAVAGFPVPIEVRWDTLTKDETYVASWNDAWPKIYFTPMVEAFKSICADDLGKEALKGALKKVIVQDAKDSYSSWWATFEGGTLTLDYQFTNVDYVDDRTKVLRETLEKAL
jgi:hypothetical protein